MRKNAALTTLGMEPLATRLDSAFELAANDTATLDDLAISALEIAAVLASLDSTLEALKSRIRDEARALKGGMTTVTVEPGGGRGKVQVTYPSPALKVDTKVSPEVIKAAVKDWERYFEERVTLRPRKGVEKLLTQYPEDLAALAPYTKVAEGTPRVGFRPGPILDPSWGE